MKYWEPFPGSDEARYNPNISSVKSYTRLFDTFAT